MRGLEEGLRGLNKICGALDPGERSGQWGCRNQPEKALQAKLSKLSHWKALERLLLSWRRGTQTRSPSSSPGER